MAYGVNDTLTQYPKAQLTWRIEQIEQIEQDQDTLVLENALPITIQADQVRHWHTLRNLALTPGDYRLSLTLTDSQGELLGLNTFKFVIAHQQKDK